MGGPAKYTDKVKAEAVKAYLGAKETVSQIAARIGCSDEAIRLWAKEPRFARKAPKARRIATSDDVGKMYAAALRDEGLIAPEPSPVPSALTFDADMATAAALDIAGFAPSLETTIQHMEARLAVLRAEMGEIEKQLPRLKAALSALQAD